MDFVPAVDEVVELALPHLEEAPQAIISFGQGCEGEPTNEWRVIAEACRAVRARTDLGTMNVNTNAGNTQAIEALCDAGMDSFRVSPVSYTHLRAHETVLDLVCRLLLEKKKNYTNDTLDYNREQ